MNKKTTFFLIFFFIVNCSLDTKSGLWTKSENLSKENNSKTKKLFVDKKILNKEFNKNLKIKLKGNYLNNSFVNNLTNNNNQINYKGPIEKISNYKFKKIDNFINSDPELLFTADKSIIFYDNTGSILKFDANSELKWKSNIYNKNEKKLDPMLSFASNDNSIIVTDSLGKYYSINLSNGKLKWSKKNTDPFNSQIKIFGEKFFVVDYSNTLRCFSIKDGSEIWKFKSTKPFIKAQQKISLVVSENLVIFINSMGEISALDNKNGSLVWQTPTQNNLLAENSFKIKNSDLILYKDSLYFSNSKSSFFSIGLNNGVINWKQNIDSNLRPTAIDNLIYTVTLEGYLVVIDSIRGNILRMTNIFEKFKKSKRNKIKPVGFVVGENKIYLSLDNGRLLIINALDGKTIETVKITGSKISRPHIFNKNMYLIKDNAIVRIN